MKKSIVIIGGGPAALMLADTLDLDKFEVQIFEKNKTVGRKFLVAGKGGFNLTHSEPIAKMIERYTPVDFLKNALLEFDNQDLRNWLAEKGIPTFVGSSKRIFPEKGIKPIEVLQAILQSLAEKNVEILTEMEWTGWGSAQELIFNDRETVKADIIVFALGGSSWKITGSDGGWLPLFAEKGIKTKPFFPANCAYEIKWEDHFLEKNGGKPLKNIAIHCGEKIQKGEVVITAFGLEGNAIYALSPQIQLELEKKGNATIYLDLKPTLELDTMLKKLRSNPNLNLTSRLRKILKLSNPQIDLLKSFLTKSEFLNIEMLAAKIKNLPLEIIAFAPIDQAISTSGGIDLDAVNSSFELLQLKNNYCIGEMLDWNAPTGGYLLQACISMGHYLGIKLNGN